MNSIIEQELYAQERRKLGFNIHLLAYLIGIFVNWVIWVIFPTEHIWPIWPTLGWSIGIIAHYQGIRAEPWLHRRVQQKLNKELNINPKK